MDPAGVSREEEPWGAGEESPPPAPWGAFPLTEVAVLVGLVMIAAGFITGGRTGTVILATGLVLGSAAGFEQALREHRAGYRSHTAVLAGIPAAVLVGVLSLIGVEPKFSAPIALAVAIACWLPLRSSFTKRS